MEGSAHAPEGIMRGYAPCVLYMRVCVCAMHRCVQEATRLDRGL